MKRINREKITAILFLAVLFSLLWGLFFTDHNVYQDFLEEYRTEVKPGTPYMERLSSAVRIFESTINDDAYKREQFVELYGYTQKTLGKRIMSDAGYGELYKTTYDQITFAVKKQDVTQELEGIKDLKSELDRSGISLLYVQAPFKLSGNEQQLPVNVKDYSNDNIDAFLKGLDQAEIDYMDLRAVLKDSGMTQNEMFFNTDHHWTINAAFYSLKSIVDRLNDSYGFHIDERYTDLVNYKQKKYPDYFIGSMGRRVGKAYGGTDDFTLITPDFETDYTLYERDYGGEKQYKGSFEEAVLNNSYIEAGTPLETNRYAVYHGDNAELEFINHNIRSGKILMVKDSFGLPIYSFLSLGVREMRALDVRLFKGSVVDYARKYKPDVVIILYNGDTFGSDMFNFKSK